MSTVLHALVAPPRTASHYTARYFVGDIMIGTSSDYALRTNGDALAIWLRPLAYFCPWCGEVWARKLYSSPELPKDFLLTTQCCAHHGSGLLLGDEWEMNRPSPPVLLRELTLLMKGKTWNRT